MQKRPIQRGRPAGSTTFEAEPALAFGAAVREARTAQGVAQETLAHRAGIERSHMGKIERGEHMPTLALIIRIARALGCSATALMAETEARLASGHESSESRRRERSQADQ
ncbi:MAG TPA: helix-turn-helix transcriptional regulator [Rhodocyclaceae bacterium]|nr:helix-turn-helix transcriptional regulator [Rhodocyclaceae bacterium]